MRWTMGKPAGGGCVQGVRRKRPDTRKPRMVNAFETCPLSCPLYGAAILDLGIWPEEPRRLLQNAPLLEPKLTAGLGFIAIGMWVLIDAEN